MRRAAVALLAVLLLLPASAAAQSEGPSRLWEVFPLEEGQPRPDDGRTPPNDGSAPPTDAPAQDDGPGPLPFVLAAAAVLAVTGGVLAAARRRGHGGPHRKRAAAAHTGKPAAEPSRASSSKPGGASRTPPPASPAPPHVGPAVEVVEPRGGASRMRTTPAKRFVREEVRGLGYVSVEAVDDAHREDLRRQVKAIRDACAATGIVLVDIVPDRESSGPVVDRPGFDRALRRLERGDATCLVATDVERLAASSEEWMLLLEVLEQEHVRLIVVEDGLDTGTGAGRDEAWSLIGLAAP